MGLAYAPNGKGLNLKEYYKENVVGKRFLISKPTLFERSGILSGEFYYLTMIHTGKIVTY